MNVRKSVFVALPLLAALALPPPSFAVQGGLFSTIVSVLVTSNPLPAPATTGLMYGGCMAYLANPVNTAANSPACFSNWVAFSCDGTYASKDIAQLLLDNAQLASTLKKAVYVEVDDTKLHNGYCTATRVDIYP